MKKRTFLKGLALAGLTTPFSGNSMARLIEKAGQIPAEQLATDDDFWTAIRGDYRLKPDYINLESGYYNILPQSLLEKYLTHIREINYQGSYYMRTVQFGNKKKMAAKVAGLVGCGEDELILTRNTTESLDMIISGFPWQSGDEAIMAEQDYGSMLEMFKQVSRRYGIVNKVISVPNHPVSDEEIVNLYENAITPHTKLLMVCHMINITGQILPVRKICDMAHSKGVQVMVDGAHAVAHIEVNIPELHCDYYGASLHKWLCAPLGEGMLFVKKEHIPRIWPIFAESSQPADDIARLNHTGTMPVHTDLAISDAVDFYQSIGGAKKEARMRFLQQYWTSKVRDLPNVIVNTPKEPMRACGIANVGIRNMLPADLAQTLLQKYKIYTVAIDGANVHGCRITPNIFTTTAELDVLVTALSELNQHT
ncbi:MAG: aminotransferase class V-fold PLP-dependent enzyme [Bacteroidota bacterium]|nr:aminotransferase class V-fold PLP-dependent enzyme [Bacteroidota bacterium]